LKGEHLVHILYGLGKLWENLGYGISTSYASTMDDREDKITDQRVASGIYPTIKLFSAEKPCGHICGGT
jgi:hypothetical protein